MKKYGTDPKLDKLVDSDNWEDRAKVAEQGYALDKLINDEDYFVRRAVAKQGYGLDKLVDDEDSDVRVAVVRQGYRLDKLIKDENWLVRVAVACKGYGLDKLINDKNSSVRIAVVWQRYGLNKLVKDEDYYVRIAVAWQGYGLDKLIHDEKYEVRYAVKDYLKKHNLTLKEWCNQNNISPSIVQYLKDFMHKVENSSKIKIETSYESVDAFFEDTSNKSYEDKESITIIAVDTNIPFIKLEKIKSKIVYKNAFKFITNISNDENSFIVKQAFDTKEKFNKLLQSTINALQEYPQFSKYADELENCL